MRFTVEWGPPPRGSASSQSVMDECNFANLTTTKAPLDERISCFAARHNAVVDWQKPLFKLDALPKVSTSQLRLCLIREDGRPVLTFGAFLNVGAKEGRQFAWFEEAKYLETHLSFLLECTPEHTQVLSLNLLDPDAYARDNYALVTQIEAVQRAPSGHNSHAIGKCLDLLPLTFEEFWRFCYPRDLSVF